jgi:hypothetical protein
MKRKKAFKSILTLLNKMNFDNVHKFESLRKSNDITLSMLEWLCSHMGKLTICGNDGRVLAVLPDDMVKEMEKYGGKRNFDPFARVNKIELGEGLYTSPGQRNFLNWAFECGVIDHLVEFKEEIQSHMIQTRKDSSTVNV